MFAPSGILALVPLFLGFVGFVTHGFGQSSDVLLTNAAQIRQLTPDQAAGSLRAQLEGVIITEAGPHPDQAAVIWDGTAGIYLLGTTNEFDNLHRGDLIRAIGVTDPGQFAPIVRVSSVAKLGTAPTPGARRVTFEELLSGGLDAQWVEISGVVRSLELEMPKETFGVWHMDIAAGGGKVSVVSNGRRPPELAPDARVLVRATCFYQFTPQRQVLRPMLLVPNGVAIEVEEPASAEAYNGPIRPVGSLLKFSPESVAGHRVHVRGIVTHQAPGSIVWIRDDSGALRISTKAAGNLQPGDVIDVLGFVKYGSYTPALEDAVFRKHNSTNAPVPLVLATSTAAYNHQADLVCLVATLLDVQLIPDGWMLTLQQPDGPFKALFRPTKSPPNTIDWKPGSVVRVTGICSINVDESTPVLSGLWRPESFQLLLRSVNDVVVVKPPSWWTPRHIILLLAGLTGGSVLITAFVMLLARRRLREQAQHRALAETEFAAILSERNRVAREIHDTLAQGLAATSVHLRLARKGINGSPEPLTHHLDLAQQLVSDSLQEARKSIWNMRSQILESTDLAGALKGILQQMADGTDVTTDFSVTGRVRRLAPMLENNILRVGQEAISNAVRHAQARTISVRMTFAEKNFSLTVEDDGTGFGPAQPLPGNGGFGLVGMRERAAHLQGELEIRSAPVRGTEVTLQVPLSGE